MYNLQMSNSPIGNTSLQTQQRNSLINIRTVPWPSTKLSQMPFLVFLPLGIYFPNQQQCLAWQIGIQVYLWISAFAWGSEKEDDGPSYEEEMVMQRARRRDKGYRPASPPRFSNN